MMRKRTTYEIYHLRAQTLTDKEYLEELHRITGISRALLKKHKVIKKLRDHGAVYNKNFAKALRELDGQPIIITVESMKEEEQ